MLRCAVGYFHRPRIRLANPRSRCGSPAATERLTQFHDHIGFASAANFCEGDHHDSCRFTMVTGRHRRPDHTPCGCADFPGRTRGFRPRREPADPCRTRLQERRGRRNRNLRRAGHRDRRSRAAIRMATGSIRSCSRCRHTRGSRPTIIPMSGPRQCSRERGASATATDSIEGPEGSAAGQLLYRAGRSRHFAETGESGVVVLITGIGPSGLRYSGLEGGGVH